MIEKFVGDEIIVGIEFITIGDKIKGIEFNYIYDYERLSYVGIEDSNYIDFPHQNISLISDTWGRIQVTVTRSDGIEREQLTTICKLKFKCLKIGNPIFRFENFKMVDEFGNKIANLKTFDNNELNIIKIQKHELISVIL